MHCRFLCAWPTLVAVAALCATVAHAVGAPENKGILGEPLRFDVTVAVTDGAAPKASDVPQVRPGQTVRVTIKGSPKTGYHTYPITTPDGEPQVEKSELRLGTVNGIQPDNALIESPPERVKSLNGVIWAYEKPFTWQQDFRVKDSAAPGVVEIPIKISTSICDEMTCMVVRIDLRAKFEVVGAGPVAAKKDEGEAPPAQKPVVDEPTAPAKTGSPKRVINEPFVGLISVSHEEYKDRLEQIRQQIVKEKPTPRDDKKAEAPGGSADLLSFILAGMFWGGISLITPCVFPMIPITVSFFLKQSEKEHHRPVVMASVYSLTIVVVLTLAAAFLLAVFRWLSINPVMNYFLGALFVFFALSLFGMYEIELPSFLARFTSAREGQGGLVGTMFMALTFTIISFACVAPFLGGFGGTAAAARPIWHNLLGGLAFSVTFAAPFFFLALFPALLRAMPKSGSWLNSVKVVMGFLELAAAFKFFRGAELLQSGGEVTLFSYDLVLGIWVALAFLCGMYLIGLFRLPHDTPAESIGVPRLLFSATFIGLGLYLTPALFKVNNEGAPQRPGGAVYAWVDAFLLPESRGGGGDNKLKTGDLYYAIEKARDHLVKTGEPKRVFVDFTGVICSNCRYNEQNVFPRPEVKQAFAQYVNVEIYTDTMPTQLYAPEVKAALAADNSRIENDAVANGEFQQKVFDVTSLPMYAILEPQRDGKILIVDVYDKGRILDVADFTRFVTGARAKDQGQLAAAQ